MRSEELHGQFDQQREQQMVSRPTVVAEEEACRTRRIEGGREGLIVRDAIPEPGQAQDQTSRYNGEHQPFVGIARGAAKFLPAAPHIRTEPGHLALPLHVAQRTSSPHAADQK